MASQEVFQHCYRNRQSVLHHMSYLRMSKVLLILHLLAEAGIRLEGKSLFDYGFGAGTFFRYCPLTTRLRGLEMDPQTVIEVREMLVKRGYQELELAVIEPAKWEQHPLLCQKHDLILCSHVLEHLPNPIAFLRRIRECLEEQGSFIGVVPVNERRANPHHVQAVDQAKIRHWAAASGMEVRNYLEGDTWSYWVQPLYTNDSALRHRLGQAVSMAFGIPATILGARIWAALSKPFGRLTFSKPAQAAFVLTPSRSDDRVLLP